MARSYHPLFLLLSLFGLFSCEEPATPNIGQIDPQLVVVSNFTNGQAIEVNISQTQAVTDPSQIIYIDDATVNIYDGANFLEQLELVQNGEKSIPFYTSRSLKPEVGVTYTILVAAPGFDQVMATSSIPPSIESPQWRFLI